MNLLDSPFFIPKLNEWFNNISDKGVKINLLAALGNCGDLSVTDNINKFLDTSRNDKKEIFLKSGYTLIRAIGCYGERSCEKFLIDNYDPQDPILSEAIIYALGRLLNEESLSYLKKLFSCESNVIKAAILETIAKYDANFINRELENVDAYKENSYLLVALIRAIDISRTHKSIQLLTLMFNNPNLLVRLCAARSVAKIAEPSYLETALDNPEMDDIVRSVFDEKLYSRYPFSPDWMTGYNYDVALARMPIRLTWPDQPKVYFQSNLDKDRFIHLKLEGVM